MFVGGTMALILLYGERQRNRLAEIGDIDEELKREYIDERSKKASHYVGKGIKLVLIAAFLSIFVTALVVKANGNNVSINGQSVYVVRSGSMSKLNPQNPYYQIIKANKWNNRFDTFDMVFVRDKPRENEFHAGDIIVYKKGDLRVIHRIVDIKRDTETEDFKWHYFCCGDANNYGDGFVYYEDIVGVYTGHKIPFVGVFVLWLQSSLGYVVVGIIVAYSIYSSYLERDLNKKRNERLLEVGYLVRLETKTHRYKYYLNPNPFPNDIENSKGIKKYITHPMKESNVKLIRKDVINIDRLEKYSFQEASKSKYTCSDFNYKIIKCVNDKYMCVKVMFKSNNKDMVKYLFFRKDACKDYIKSANKAMRYLLHSGKLNKLIKKQLKLYGNAIR